MQQYQNTTPSDSLALQGTRGRMLSWVLKHNVNAWTLTNTYTTDIYISDSRFVNVYDGHHVGKAR